MIVVQILLKFCKDISKTLNGRLAAAASSGGDDHECCVPVVDSNTFIFTIGGAAVAVWFLRFTKHLYNSSNLCMSVIRETIITALGRRRRSASSGILRKGNSLCVCVYEGEEEIFSEFLLTPLRIPRKVSSSRGK